jgi:TonB family protein
MLEVLVASRPSGQTRPVGFFTATALHASFLGLCLLTSGVTVQVASRAVDDTTLIFLPRLDPPKVEMAPRVLGRPGGGGGDGSGFIMSADPPPRGFQAVDIVASVPTGIPGIDPNARYLDPRDFTGKGVEGGRGWGVVGGVGDPDQVVPTAQGEAAIYAAELEDARFSPAEMVVQPKFVYPRLLMEQGVAGRVTLQFIVDTLGDVEPRSVEVLKSTHEAFASAAKDGILEARFEPARYGGHHVRQLSRMPVSFTTEVKEASR